MGGRGSASRSGAEDYYRSVEPSIIDFIRSDDLDRTENEDYLRRFARWLGELGDDIDHYFTDPIDPNSPAGRYFQRQAEIAAKLQRGEPLTAADLTITEDDYAFLSAITFAFGLGALSNGPVTIAGSRRIPNQSHATRIAGGLRKAPKRDCCLVVEI